MTCVVLVHAHTSSPDEKQKVHTVIEIVPLHDLMLYKVLYLLDVDHSIKIHLLELKYKTGQIPNH